MGEKGIELIGSRTYNRKVFDLGNGKKLYRCYAGHVHYKDENGNFKEIDTTIRINGKGKPENTAGNYKAVLPTSSDDWIEFRNKFEGNDHIIREKPVCRHVKGEIYNNKDEGGKNFILYKDAFGEGIDLKLIVRRHGLHKVIRINKQPSSDEDLIFDFEIELPDEEIRVKKKRAILWDKQSDLDVTERFLLVGNKKHKTIMPPAVVWDSNKPRRPIPINIKFIKKDGKLYLRKIIPLEFLKKAKYPVYTDHPASYYAYSGDGITENYNSDWDTIRNAQTGRYADSTSEVAWTGLYYSWTEYGKSVYIDRNVLIFDTSAIPDNEDIISATLNIKTEDYWIDNLDGYMAMVDAWLNDPASGVTIDDFGNIDLSGNRIADDYDTTDFSSPETWYQWEIWDDSVINKYGYTDIAIISSFDADDNEPGYGQEGYDWVTFYTGDSYDPPYLDITTQAAGTTIYPSVLNVSSSLGTTQTNYDYQFSVSTLTLTSSPLTPTYSVSLTHTASTLNIISELVSPSFSFGVSVSPSTLELTSDLISPTYTFSSLYSPTTLQLASNLIEPTYEISYGALVSPTTLSLTSDLVEPSYSISSTYIPTTLDLTSNVLSPSISISIIATPSALTLDSELLSPVVKYTCSFLASTLTLTSNLLNPSIQIVGATYVYPSTLNVTSEALVPSITTEVILTPSSLSITSTLKNPSLSVGAIISPSTFTLSAVLSFPAINYDYQITATSLELTSNLIGPSFSISTIFGASSLEITPNLLSPSITAGVIASPSTLSLTSNLLSPSISLSLVFDATTISLTSDLLDPIVVIPTKEDKILILRLKRLGGDAEDTLGDVAYLTAMNFNYISNKLGE